MKSGTVYEELVVDKVNEAALYHSTDASHQLSLYTCAVGWNTLHVTTTFAVERAQSKKNQKRVK